MKRLHDVTLGVGVQVNQQIPAAHEIQTRERRVADDILAREYAQLTDALGNAVVMVHLDEKSFEAFSRDLLRDIVEVEPSARFLDLDLTDIGPKDLNPGNGTSLTHIFEQRDRDRIHLLSARAPGNPDPNGIFRGTSLAEAREHSLLQTLEGVGISEKSGDSDQKILVQRRRFLRIILNDGNIVSQILDLAQRHPSREPAPQGAALVV